MTALAGEPATVGWYVYGVAPASAAENVSRHVAAAGAVEPGRGVRVVPGGSLAAIVSEVTSGEFGEPALRERLNDWRWLEEKARAHDAVLGTALRGAPVVPLRFGTVCRELTDVHELLSRRGPELERALERVRGRVELGVKGFVDRERLAHVLREERVPEPDGAGASAGRGYLLRRQLDRRVDEEVAAFRAGCGEGAHRRLSALAAESRRNRPQSPKLAGRDDEMFLNGAYLVDAHEARFHAEVDVLGHDYERFAVEFELTGPWPPYNFVAEDEQE